MKTKKTLILAKRETTYGTDPLPTASANVIEALDVSVTPLEASYLDRGLVRPWFGAKGSVLGDAYSIIEFSCELAGSGTAGTAPAWGVLLRGCGYSEVITAGVKVDYNTVSDGIESIALYAYIDGVIQKLLGARGNVSFDFSAGQLPTAKFKFLAKYAKPVDGAFPSSPTFTAWKAPLVCNKVNTALSLFGVNLNAQSLSIDTGNTVNYRNLFNQEDIVISDRAVTGSTRFEMTTVATKDWFGLATDGTTGVLALTHGTVAGNKVQFAATDMRLSNPKYSDHLGDRFLDASLEFVPNTGSDDITITAL